MTRLEMGRLLLENPTWKGKSNKTSRLALNEGGKICFDDMLREYVLMMLVTGEDWEIIKPEPKYVPITWQEACELEEVYRKADCFAATKERYYPDYPIAWAVRDVMQTKWYKKVETEE